MRIAFLALLISWFIVGCQKSSSGSQETGPAPSGPVDQFAAERAMLIQKEAQLDQYAQALKSYRQCVLDSQCACAPPVF